MKKAYTPFSIIIQTLCVFIIGLALALPHSAYAYFSGNAEADTNAFEIGTLAVEAVPAVFSEDITAAGSVDVVFTSANVGSIDSQYMVSASPVACSGAFFDGLDVAVDHDGPLYSGVLDGFSATSTDHGSWSFGFSANGDLVAGEDETCELGITLEAWQGSISTYGSTGFTDTASVTVTLTAAEDIGSQPTPTLVLNEIYPAVLATTTEPLDREWVELYNGTGAAVDVLGWQVSEVSGTTTKKYTIVASGATFGSEVQPYGGASTVIPAGGLLVVEFGGSKLNNSGDTVGLYNASDTLLDSYTYPSTTAGKSHARIPDGSTWVDPIPTPGIPNTATEEELRNEGWSEERIKETLAELNGSTVVNECTDNIDNDGDGWFDERDPGCEGPDDMIEGHPYKMEVFLGLVDGTDASVEENTGTSTEDTSTSTPPIEDTGTTTPVVDNDTGTSTPPIDLGQVGTSTPPIETGTSTPSASKEEDTTDEEIQDDIEQSADEEQNVEEEDEGEEQIEEETPLDTAPVVDEDITTGQADPSDPMSNGAGTEEIEETLPEEEQDENSAETEESEDQTETETE